MCPFLRWRIKEEKRKLTKSDIEKTNHGNGLVPNGTGKKLKHSNCKGTLPNFEKMETKTSVRTNVRHMTCCQTLLIARPPSLFISCRLARSRLMCKDSLIFLKGSAIAEHVLKTGHSIAWDKAQVIDYEQRWGARKIKESLHIKRERANRQLMNRDGGLAFSRVWQHVI